MAPRVIQVNGFTSEAIHVFRSILAGCKSSVALTRVYSKRAINDIHVNHKESNPEVYVDDTCIQAINDIMVPAVPLFREEAKLLKLGLSDKATAQPRQQN